MLLSRNFVVMAQAPIFDICASNNYSLHAGKSKWGLSKWGRHVLVHNCLSRTCPQLSTIAYNCRHFATKVPLRNGPKRPQKCTFVDDRAQIAKSDLKPPFESPYLDFPDAPPKLPTGFFMTSTINQVIDIPTLPLPQFILGNSWLLECVFAVYKSAELPTSCLPTRGGFRIVLVILHRLRPENHYLGNSAGVDCTNGFFLLISVGKKCPEKSSKKIPGKTLQNPYNKNPGHISAEGPGQQMRLQ